MGGTSSKLIFTEKKADYVATVIGTDAYLHQHMTILIHKCHLLLVVEVALRFEGHFNSDDYGGYLLCYRIHSYLLANVCFFITGFSNPSLMSGRVPSVKDETGAVSIDLHTS